MKIKAEKINQQVQKIYRNKIQNKVSLRMELFHLEKFRILPPLTKGRWRYIRAINQYLGDRNKQFK